MTIATCPLLSQAYLRTPMIREIVFTGSTWADEKANAEQGMTRLSSCVRNNLLTLNTIQTNYICFSIYNISQLNPDFNLKYMSAAMRVVVFGTVRPLRKYRV